MIKEISPFDHVKNIYEKDENFFKTKTLISDETYIPYIVNKALSKDKSLIYAVNTMNIYHGLDKKMQHDFFYHLIKKQKRPFHKWEKSNQDKQTIETIMFVYKCSYSKAVEYFKLLNNEQLEHIKSIERSKNGS